MKKKIIGLLVGLLVVGGTIALIIFLPEIVSTGEKIVVWIKGDKEMIVTILLSIAAIGCVSLGLAIKLVPQMERWIVEMFEKYRRTIGPGLCLTIPFLEQIEKKVSLKNITVDLPKSDVITKDGIKAEIDGFYVYRLEDDKPKEEGASYKFAYTFEDLKKTTDIGAVSAFRRLTAERRFDEKTAREKVIKKGKRKGEKIKVELESLLQARDELAREMKREIAKIVKEGGIEIIQTGIKSIDPPPEILESLRKIKEAKWKAKSVANEARGEAEAQKLLADAEREAIEKIAMAGEKRMSINDASRYRLARENIKAWEKVASSPSAKVVMSNDAARILGPVTAIGEIFKNGGK